jgi:hypothetical protein
VLPARPLRKNRKERGTLYNRVGVVKRQFQRGPGDAVVFEPTHSIPLLAKNARNGAPGFFFCPRQFEVLAARVKGVS